MPYIDAAKRRMNRKRYYQIHKDMWSDYYLRNKPRLALYSKKYYRENENQIKDRAKQWTQNHLERAKAKTKSWILANPERIRAAKRKWAKNNPDKLRAKDEHWRKANPVKVSIRNRKAKYGLTDTEYEFLKTSQHGACAICGKTKDFGGNGKCLVVDHDHSANKVRGLLCNSCNRALGYFRDSREIVKKALNYLEKYGGVPCPK